MEKITGIKINDGLAFGTVCIREGPEDAFRFPESDTPPIILSENLTPNETVRFGQMGVKALVVTGATDTSHTAILARTMNWPAVSGIKIDPAWAHKTAIVDGNHATLIIDPDEAARRYYQRKQAEAEEAKNTLLRAYKNKKTVTKSGKEIKLYANISTPSDISDVLANGAEGIGNFKTEFMYLNSPDYPEEEALFQAYKKIAGQMSGQKVVIRTFDIGTDKTADYFGIGKEENPALGYRAIRIGLDRPEIFKTQLRAIIRAGAYGKVAIMYPMIVSVDEVLSIKKLVARTMDELEKEGIPFDRHMEQGIMIETPAAVIMSRELARIVDFFSIGTNDLIQYTLAADRQNPKLGSIYNPYHPAVLRSIRYVVENAHRAGIWTSVSGELGADSAMTETFIKWGIDALAAPPSKILPLRKKICEMNETV